jgi:hypothetical protein
LEGGVGHCSNKPMEVFADEDDEIVIKEDDGDYAKVIEQSADGHVGATTGMDEDAALEYGEEEEEVDSDDESSNDSSDHSDDGDLGPEDGEEDGDDEDNHNPYNNF